MLWKMAYQSVSFGSKQKNIDQIPRNITHFIFGNEAPMAALSNYSILYLMPSSQGSIYLWYNPLVLHPHGEHKPLLLSWLYKLHLIRLTGAEFNLACIKTRRGSPVDDRPSTNKLHYFVWKKKKKKKSDMWHVTCDTWYVTHDTWHMTCDTWHVWGGEHSLKISAP